MDKVNMRLVQIDPEYRGRLREDGENQSPGGEENSSE